MAQEELTKQEVDAWRLAAVEDGWSIEPTYQNEPIEQAAKLCKDSWAARTISRPSGSSFPGSKESNSINVWGPDRLQVRPGIPYSMDALVAGLRTCHKCGAQDVDTTQYYFAGRVCLECRKVLKEHAGWTR